MALGLRSWIGLVAAACAVAAFALLPPPRSQDPFFFALAGGWGSASNRLEPRVRRAYDLSRTLTLGDSLLRVLPRGTGSHDRVTVLVSSGLPASTRPSLEALLAPARSRLAQGNGPTRLVFALVVDTLSPAANANIFWEARLQFAYLLPRGTDGRTCLVVAALSNPGIVRLRRGLALDSLVRQSLWWQWGEEPLRGALLGPCAYYVAFGPAGRGVEAWLQSSDYIPALDPVWVVGGSQPLGRHRIDWARGTSWWRSEWSFWRFPDLEACASGLQRRCAQAVLGAAEPWWNAGYTFRVAGEMSVPGVANLGRLERRSAPRLGFLAPAFVNDLLEDVGPERFAAFWRSDAPVEEAFAQAIGVPLGDWTRDWVQGQVGVAARASSVPPFAAVSALLLALALFAGGAALATRRVVG